LVPTCTLPGLLSVHPALAATSVMVSGPAALADADPAGVDDEQPASARTATAATAALSLFMLSPLVMVSGI
jgi:hypothetical protein